METLAQLARLVEELTREVQELRDRVYALENGLEWRPEGA
jgi:polyhydroxyalkanoate synthesis regulator phasin